MKREGRLEIMWKEFIRNVEAKLIERGVAKAEDFSPSSVTAEDIAIFENRFQVKLPEVLKAYLSTACFDFNYIMAAVPVDIDAETIQDEEYECDTLWLDILSVPKGQPLKDLSERMEGFREGIEEGFYGITLEDAQNFLVIGDWMAGAGPMCIDLSKPDEQVDINDEDTWNIRWFDHEEFEWDSCYMEDGVLVGDAIAPDFRTLLEWYFGGKYDEIYEQQCKEYGVEPSPRNKWLNMD